VQKIAVFTYRSALFVFPGDAPAIVTQYVAWMERRKDGKREAFWTSKVDSERAPRDSSGDPSMQ